MIDGVETMEIMIKYPAGGTAIVKELPPAGSLPTAFAVEDGSKKVIRVERREEGDLLVDREIVGRHWKLVEPVSIQVGRLWGEVREDFCSIEEGSEKIIQYRKGPGDYCISCGTFQGPLGEYREGHSCYMCGMN